VSAQGARPDVAGLVESRQRWRAHIQEASRRTRARRTAWQAVMVAVAVLAVAVALFPLVDMVAVVTVRGIQAIGIRTFTQVTNGVSGGLENAILGTTALVWLGLVLAAPVGVGAGIYLADWSGPSWRRSLRYLTDVLTGVPSIVVGYFGYTVFVSALGWGFSLVAGSIALAIIMLPYIVRTSELALAKVPQELKEGSLALGVTRAATVHAVSLPVALPSILTGILLALGIGVGETAPLLYTAEWSNFNPSSLWHSPVGYLTYVVWSFIQEPFASAHALAYAAALLLMAGVLALNLLARQILARRDPHLGH
jgi:phosphate transport system permease protein